MLPEDWNEVATVVFPTGKLSGTRPQAQASASISNYDAYNGICWVWSIYAQDFHSPAVSRLICAVHPDDHFFLGTSTGIPSAFSLMSQTLAHCRQLAMNFV